MTHEIGNVVVLNPVPHELVTRDEMKCPVLEMIELNT
jgi:hypothetical protein